MATRITTTALLTANGETTNASIDVINDGETTIITADRFVGNLNGNADTATRLNEPFRLNFTGDAEGSVMLGTANTQVDLTVKYAQEATVAERTGRAANADISNFAHLANLANFAVYAGRASYATHAETADEATLANRALKADQADLAIRAMRDSEGRAIITTYATKTGVSEEIGQQIRDANLLPRTEAAAVYQTKVAAELARIRNAVVYGQATGTGEMDGNTLRILITDLASELAQSIIEYTGEFDPLDKLTTQLYCNYEAHALYWYSPSSERWINLLGEGTDTEEIWRAIRDLQLGGAASGVIVTPTNLTPANNAENISVLPTLTASSYKNAFTEDLRDRREFRICAHGDQFRHILWSGSDNADSMQVTDDLPQNTALDWQCRDVSEDGLYSNWSGYTTFRTSVSVEIVKPVVTVSTKPDSTVVANPVISSTPFTLNNSDATDECASTRIVIKKKADGTTVYDQTLTGDVTSYKLPSGILQTSTLYEVTVAKTGEKYPTVTSNAVSFTTAARFAYIEAPTITIIGYGQNNVGKFPSFNISSAVTVDDEDTITGLEVTLYDTDNNILERQVITTDGSSASTYTLQRGLEVSTVYSFKARYIGTLLQGDTGANTFRTRARFQFVQAPTVTVEQQPSGVMPNPHLYGSPFTVVESEVQNPQHTSTSWRVTDLTTGNVIWSSNFDAVNKTSIQVNANLVEGHRYRADVTYHSNDVPDSDTGVLQFQTANVFIYVNNPSLVVEGASADVPQFPTLTIGGFSIFNGTSDPVTDECINTIIKVYDNTDNLLRTYNAPSEETTEEVEGETVTHYTPVTSYRITENFMLPNTTYKFAVQHVGRQYGTSSETVVTAKTVAVFPYIATPTLTTNANSRGLQKQVILTGNAFTVTDGTVTYPALYNHVSTDWYAYKVTEENGETVKTLIWSSLADTTNKTTITVGVDMEVNSSYEFKAVYHSDLLDSGVAMVTGTTPSSFVTIETPTLTTELNLNGDLRSLPSLKGSEYRVFIDEDDVTAQYPHVSTDWRCYKVQNGERTLVWSSIADTTHLTEIAVTTPLEVNTSYIFECVYNAALDSSEPGMLSDDTGAEFIDGFQMTMNNSNRLPLFTPQVDASNYKVYKNGVPLDNVSAGQNINNLAFATDDVIKITAAEGTWFPKLNVGQAGWDYLKSIDTPLPKMTEDFTNFTPITSFSEGFSTCYSLVSFPGDLFKNNTEITDFSGCFSGCYRLTSLPSDLFKYNTKATNFYGCFAGCYGLTSVPADLFKYNTEATNFAQLWSRCNGLNTVPADLFKYNTKATILASMFSYNTGITSVPADLFKYNTEATNLGGIFLDCTSLTTIPANIFEHNTKVESFYGCFSGCTNITSALPQIWDGSAIWTAKYPKLTNVTQYARNCTQAANYSSIPYSMK